MADKKEDLEDKKARRKAKKDKKNQMAELGVEEEDKLSSKILLFFVTLFIIVIWLAIFGLLIKMDVGGFGSSVLYPVLKDVPYVNKILPETTDVTVMEEDTQYQFRNMDEAIDRIKELEMELAEAQTSGVSDNERIAELESQVAELSVYKEEQIEFENLKEKFYEEVVFSDSAPDIEEYKTYYESIDPANAEVLYKQVVEQNAYSQQIDDYVKTYSSMKPKEAAAIFDSMTDDLGLVADILMNMNTQARADILGKMDSETAAKVTELMEPKKK